MSLKENERYYEQRQEAREERRGREFCFKCAERLEDTTRRTCPYCLLKWLANRLPT